jgi:YfiH family protein
MTVKKIFHPKLEFGDITHGFFTRKGGYSKSPYNSLNCSFNVDDNESDVKKNLKSICNELKLGKLIRLNQIHSSKVLVINSEYDKITDINADGLVTKLKGVGLSVLGADCAPILFYDKMSKIIGACHAGWRGAINGIIEATITNMENLGAKRDDIVSVIGPTIHKESYEIQKDLALLVKETKFYKNNRSILLQVNQDKYLFDLPLLIKESLKFSKINNFGDININTYEKSDLFFSHRKSTHENFPKIGKTGRHISVIGLIS